MMKNRFRMITVFLACLALAAGMLAGASAGTSVEGGSAGAPASSETDFRMRLLNLKAKGWDRNQAVNAVYESYRTIASRELIEKITDMVFG